jgi:copper chaperone NosL
VRQKNETSNRLVVATRHRRVVLIAILAIVCMPLVSSACHGGPLKPVALEPDDMCSYCKMAISSKRYAAEFIDREGQAFKFDDIGCMISYINDKKDRDAIAVAYVNDFNNSEWLRAEEGHYLRSNSFDTPMSFGIVAFKDTAEADAARAQYKADAFRFDDLFGVVRAPREREEKSTQPAQGMR